MVEVPAVAPAVVTVIVELLPGTTGLGENVTVEPAGLPVADSVTKSVKPDIDVVLTV
jgi:hypothetical protein